MIKSTIGLVALASMLRVCGRNNPPAPAVGPGVAVTAAVAPNGAPLPAPRHGGRVQLVGNYALETVAARTGGVAMFWMELDGTPIPASEVSLSSVRVDVDGRARVVPVRVVGGAYVASLPVPSSAAVAVTVPLVVVHGVTFESVVVPSVVVVAALPGIIIVAPTTVVVPAVGWRGKNHKFRGGFIRFR